MSFLIDFSLIFSWCHVLEDILRETSQWSSSSFHGKESNGRGTTTTTQTTCKGLWLLKSCLGWLIHEKEVETWVHGSFIIIIVLVVYTTQVTFSWKIPGKTRRSTSSTTWMQFLSDKELDENIRSWRRRDYSYTKAVREWVLNVWQMDWMIKTHETTSMTTRLGKLRHFPCLHIMFFYRAILVSRDLLSLYKQRLTRSQDNQISKLFLTRLPHKEVKTWDKAFHSRQSRFRYVNGLF